MLPYHFESTAEVGAAASAVFSYMDDHRRLSSHMSNSSWMMAGSRMEIELDASEGHAVGSIIRLHGLVLGIAPARDYYNEAMPRLPVLGTGLLPATQWLIIPTIVKWFVRRQIGAPPPRNRS